MSDESQAVSGRCFCGAVHYRAGRVSPEITECHCSQCRRQSGHRYATTSTKRGDVEIDGAASLTWFSASPDAERGFCSTCGCHLFWRSRSDDTMAILAASIDDPTGLRMTGHIFVQDKGTYYEITDGLAQFDGYDTPHTPE